MRAGDHQIVAGQVKLLYRQRHQRQVLPVVPPGSWQPLKEGDPDRPAAQEPTLLQGDKIDEAIEVGIGIDSKQLLQHPLGPGEGDQPIVNNGNSHQTLIAMCSARSRRVSVAQWSQLKRSACERPRSPRSRRRSWSLTSRLIRAASSCALAGSK